jgi:hypothetical protein
MLVFHMDLFVMQRLVGGSEALRLRLFAKFLLEGEVVAPLAKYRVFLNTKPSALVTSFAPSQKTTALLSALSKHKIDSKSKLLAKWYSLQVSACGSGRSLCSYSFARFLLYSLQSGLWIPGSY